MKYFITIILILGIGLFSSCEKCDTSIIEEPEVFDCPDLGLNFGDSCNDMNPETSNDMVNDFCECLGVVEVQCPGTFYSQIVGDVDYVDHRMINFDHPILDGFGEVDIENLTIQPELNSLRLVPDNSSYDEANNVYAFSFLSDDTEMPSSLMYFLDVDEGNSNEVNVSAIPGAPIFYNSNIYALQIVSPGNIVEVMSIDQSSGNVTILQSLTVSNNAPINYFSMTSAADDQGRLYFISAINEFIYDVNAGTLDYNELEPDFNPDFVSIYLGLEYDEDNNRLLALNYVTNSNSLSLVEIGMGISGTPSILLDIQSSLNPSIENVDIAITANSNYSSCLNKYYFSVLDELEPGNDQLESNFHQIDLNSLQIDSESRDGLIYGLELRED